MKEMKIHLHPFAFHNLKNAFLFYFAPHKEISIIIIIFFLRLNICIDMDFPSISGCNSHFPAPARKRTVNTFLMNSLQATFKCMGGCQGTGEKTNTRNFHRQNQDYGWVVRQQGSSSCLTTTAHFLSFHYLFGQKTSLIAKQISRPCKKS